MLGAQQHLEYITLVNGSRHTHTHICVTVCSVWEESDEWRREWRSKRKEINKNRSTRAVVVAYWLRWEKKWSWNYIYEVCIVTIGRRVNIHTHTRWLAGPTWPNVAYHLVNEQVFFLVFVFIRISICFVFLLFTKFIPKQQQRRRQQPPQLNNVCVSSHKRQIRSASTRCEVIRVKKKIQSKRNGLIMKYGHVLFSSRR